MGNDQTLYSTRRVYIPCTTAVVPMVKCTMGQKQKQLSMQPAPCLTKMRYTRTQLLLLCIRVYYSIHKLEDTTAAVHPHLAYHFLSAAL